MVYWNSTLSILSFQPSVFSSKQNIPYLRQGVYRESTLPVLHSGYMVKYSPPPLRVPLGLACRNSPRRWAIFDRMSLVLIRIQHIISFHWRITLQNKGSPSKLDGLLYVVPLSSDNITSRLRCSNKKNPHTGDKASLDRCGY